MSLIEINWSPTDRQLRQFGVAGAVLLPLAGCVWGLGIPLISGLATAGCAMAAAAWTAPHLLRAPFIALSIVAAPIGIVVGEATLLVLFFGVFLPTSLLMRLGRRDPLERRFDKSAATYWRPVSSRDPASYFRQS